MAGLQLLHGRGIAGEGMQGQRPQWKTVTVKALVPDVFRVGMLCCLFTK